ncbi:MAG: sulfatase-like hydrolase/transferase [Saprospiraceae bacterium]|nr:sulfatase-like hydrolase/transferase [Saprospiraceae bacterium]
MFITYGQDHPNILFIIGDDMGVDMLEGYEVGSNLPGTPNIDQLRSSGLTFRNVWGAPVCSPTRAAILTGKYGINNGVNNVPGILTTNQKSIFKEITERTDGIYKSCVVGKWHLSRRNDPDHPLDHGADEFMGFIGGGVEDYYQWEKIEDGIVSNSVDYATSYFTDYAIDWINSQSDPWLMWLAHAAPHTPYHVPPDGTFTQPMTNSNKQQYRAMIESLDFEIGRLIDGIPDDVLNNTIIIFLGDNGTPNNMLQTYPERRGKGSLYQGGIHVPMIISGHGVTRVNENEFALVNVTDLYATISQIVDPASNSEINDALSFKHLLSTSVGVNREYNYMGIGSNEENGEEERHTVRNERYKLIRNGQDEELYDLEIDPFEENDLILAGLTSDQQKIKERLDSVLNEILNIDTEDTMTSGEGKVDHYPVVHTGVEDFYSIDDILLESPSSDQVFYWQDAGRVTNTPSYSDNGDGTVTDHVTGLMWEQDMGDKITFAEALIKADTSTLGGYEDWRVPSIKELYSLILFTGQVRGESAILSFIDTDYFIQPLGDVAAGEREIDAQTWSNTHYNGLTYGKDTTIFGVNFIDGRIKGYPKYQPRNGSPNSFYFRLVRGNEYYGKNLLYDNGDETITDSTTMLMWQKADDGIGRDWLSSIEYCENLTLGGYEDWHLPHAKELHSIVDYDRSPTATSSPAIDSLFNTTEIDDPGGNPGHYPNFWTSTTHLDGSNPFSGAVYIAFGQALGRVNDVLLDVHGAGAQRSDPKTGDPNDYPQYRGPQGDAQIVFNHCRCVRDISSNTTSFNEDLDFNIKIYPNPSSLFINIEISQDVTEDIQLSIFDLNGYKVMQRSFRDQSDQIDVTHLPEGMYLISVKIKGKTPQSFKFIKGN